MLTKEYIIKSAFSGRTRVPWDHERVPDHQFYSEGSYHGDKEEKKVSVKGPLSKIEKQAKGEI